MHYQNNKVTAPQIKQLAFSGELNFKRRLDIKKMTSNREWKLPEIQTVNKKTKCGIVTLKYQLLMPPL